MINDVSQSPPFIPGNERVWLSFCTSGFDCNSAYPGYVYVYIDERMYVVQWNECLGVELCPITEEIEFNRATVAISESHGWCPDLPVHGSGVVIPRLISFPRTRIRPLWVKDVPTCRASISPPTHEACFFFFFSRSFIFLCGGSFSFLAGFISDRLGRSVLEESLPRMTSGQGLAVVHTDWTLILAQTTQPTEYSSSRVVVVSYRRVIQGCGLPEQGKVYVWYLTF